MTFAVVQHRHGAYDFDRDLREQEGFAEHAAFMDALTADGFVRLGGPLADGRRVLLIVEAADPTEIEARFAADPWIPSHLRIASIDPWEILLGAP